MVWIQKSMSKFFVSSKTDDYCPLNTLKNKQAKQGYSKGGVTDRPASRQYNAPPPPPSDPTRPPAASFTPANPRVHHKAAGSPHEALTRSTSFLNPRIDYRDDNPNRDIIVAEFPGLTKNNLEVLIEDGYVSVLGKKKEERKDAAKRWELEESKTKECKLRFRLPENADVDMIEANWNKSVLTVTVPKLPTMEMVALDL